MSSTNNYQKDDESAIQAWITLHRVHRYLIENVENTLKQAGLPPLDWYDVLLELYRAGDSGLRQFEIGQRILLNKHNLSRLLDRLQQQKLLHRQNCEEDGRGYRIYITEEGIQTLKKIWPVYHGAINSYFAAKLTKKECESLRSILQKIMT